AAPAIDFPALEREVHVVAARITGDDLHAGAEHAIDDARKLVRIGGGAGAADIQHIGQQVVELGDFGAAVPYDAHADLFVGAADPVEFRSFELRRLVAEQRIKAGAAPDGS